MDLTIINLSENLSHSNSLSSAGKSSNINEYLLYKWINYNFKFMTG